MMTSHRAAFAALLALTLMPAAFSAQTATPTAAEAAEAAAQRARQDRLPDTRGSGPYPALKEEVASLPDHVVYRPAALDSLGTLRLGVYLFGNGACVNDGASSRLHLLEIASHGYLAIAPGRIRSGPGATAPLLPMGPGLQGRTAAAELLSGLDWALAQNLDPKSPLHNRIDPAAIAVSGYSCGGLQALKIAGDPRVKTVIVMNSGVLIEPAAVALADMDATKDVLDTLHTPTLYLLGGPKDIAYPNGMDDFRRIDHVPVVMANLKGKGHGGTYWEPNGGRAASAVVAWLHWQLRGDARAGRAFTGDHCGLCRDDAWTIERKGVR